LKGAEPGPDAHYDLNLDTDGLVAVSPASVDCVVASHVIEHVCNPLKVLVDIERVLRPSGRLVLIVPDRRLTFDHIRRPTAFKHLFREFRDGVTELSEAHIREFCQAIFVQPSMHPAIVRDWHDPRKLDSARFDLHRRRSIHVHCWSPEEFASTLVAAIGSDVLSLELESLYFSENIPEGSMFEFGLVLVKAERVGSPESRAKRFAEMWTDLASDAAARPLQRIGRFQLAVRRDLSGSPNRSRICAFLRSRTGFLSSIQLRIEPDTSTFQRLRLSAANAIRRLSTLRA
jgi:hypothetical protein